MGASSSSSGSSLFSGNSSSESSGSKKKSGWGSYFSSDDSSSSSSSESSTSGSKKKSALESFLSGDDSSSSSKSSSSGSSSSSSGSSSSSEKKGFFGNMFGNDSSSSSESESSVQKTSQEAFKSIAQILRGNSILERGIFIILVIICFTILLSVGSNLLSAILEPNNPYFVDGLYTATNGKVIPQDPSKNGAVTIARSDNETYGIEFSWSVWLNVSSLDDNNSLNSAQYKHVFSKGDNDNVPIDSRGINAPNNSPGLYIDKNTNSLVVIMNTFEQIEEVITVTDMPMNKWVHVLIRVEGAFFDVYVNGTLAKRKVMASVPKQNNGSVYLCQNGGFSGFISNLRYYRNALDPGDIINIVNQGPNLKLSKLEKNDLKKNKLNYLAMDWYFQNAR
jgi:hypothetical protein